MRFLGRLFITMVGLWIAAALVPGILLMGFGTILLAALLLGLVNALVRPVFVLLTLPFTVVTLGLFLLVINAILLGLVALVLPGFMIAGFGAAFLGALIVTLFSWCANWFVSGRDR
ncbi:phage holin family protein [bacterium]|nr:phage holin family protein [bacterium]